jgi:hypothetical protein
MCERHISITIHDAPRHPVPWCRLSSEELKLSTALFNKQFEWLDNNPALMGIVVCLTQQGRIFRLVGQLLELLD